MGKDFLSALTKAKMADQLFDELGLNKREAKEIVELFFDEILILEATCKSNSPALVTSICEKKVSVQAGTPKPAKKSRSAPVVW